jgi:hypothetical protein
LKVLRAWWVIESLLKTAPIISVPRLLNSFFPLVKAIPDEESMDNVHVRKDVRNQYDHLTERGAQYMKDVFGKGDMEGFIATMLKFWPDLRKTLPTLEIFCPLSLHEHDDTDSNQIPWW